MRRGRGPFPLYSLRFGLLLRFPSRPLLLPFLSFLFRAAFLASELVVAAALRGAGAGDMQALAGAVSGPALCYAAPFACHLALFAGEHSRPRRWAFLAFVVAGGLLCVFGTYYSVLGVVEAASSYTIFGGSCRLAAERA